jgi:hypothetical protein
LDAVELFILFRQKFYVCLQALTYAEHWGKETDIPYLRYTPGNYNMTEGKIYYKEDWCLCCGEYLLWTKAYCKKCPPEGKNRILVLVSFYCVDLSIIFSSQRA